MVDLRKDKRAPASLKVKYKSATVDQFIEQFGTDVSRGGIFIKTKKPIETGALLKLELQLNDASPVIHGIGRVCFRREIAQEPNLPAGMGIKFIKLDPGSRAIVERIVNARGEKPSRFDQTDGAEVAPASLPPDADEFTDLRLSGAPAGDPMSLAPAPPSAKPPAAAAPSMPVAARTRPTIDPVRPASEPARATPNQPRAPMRPTPSGPASPQAAPRAGSGSRPFPRSGSGANAHPGAANPPSGSPRGPAIEAPLTGPGSKPERFPGLEPSKPPARGAAVPPPKRAGVAGLFANSPIAQSAPVEPPATNNGRSSFFPPAPNEAPASAPPQRGRARDLGSQRPPFTPRGPAEAARAEQARHSGEFLATAFEQGGVTRATTEQARVNAAAAQATGEDSLIDELFAGVVEPPPASAPATRNGAPQSSVDDMFAELSQEEGLAGARRASSQGAIQAPALPSVPATARVPAARKSQPGRATEDDGVDALFAELDAPSQPPLGVPTPLPKAPPPSGAPPSYTSRHAQDDAESVPPFADSVAPSGKSGGAWSDAPSNEEADLDAGEAAPLFSEPPRLADADAQQSQSTPEGQAKRPASAALFIGLAALVLAAGGGYVYYSRVVQPSATVAAVPLPKIAAPSEKPAAEAAQPNGANAPTAPAAAAEIEVEVSAVPRGADVTVNGKRRGLAPTRVTLVAGQAARVTVSNSGFASMTKTVTPEAGQEPLRFELEPLPYSLIVRTSPAGAELTAGASSATAPGPLDLGHLDGGVLVSVAKPGFQRMTRPVRLDEFTEQDGVMRAEIEVRLTELPRGAGDSVRARIRRRPDEPPAPEAPPAPPAEAAPDAPEAAAPAAAPPAAPEPPPGLPELPPEVAKPAEAAP